MMSSLRKKISISRLPPLPDASLVDEDSNQSASKIPKRDYSLLDWNGYFDKSEVVSCGNNKFNVYIKGSGNLLVVFLHGAAFSGLSWSLLAKQLTSSVDCTCLAIDQRSHGNTQTENEDELSIDTLASDATSVITTWNKEQKNVVLVGHSLGGSVAVYTALQLEKLSPILGLVVIDVVEGSAMRSLSSMRNIVRSRPSMFKTIEEAIKWSVKSGYIRNIDSARVSMTGQLVKQPLKNRNSGSSEEKSFFNWRVDLLKSESYWKGWFEGLSAKFLSVKAPKVLCITGVDLLDKDLAVGQMQGKFQLVVIPQTGHVIHEDDPKFVSSQLTQFFIRHRLTKKIDLS